VEINSDLYNQINEILKMIIKESACKENEFIYQELKQQDTIIGLTYKPFKNLWIKIYHNMKNRYRIIVTSSTFVNTNNYSDILKLVNTKNVKLLDNGTIQIDIEKDKNILINTLTILKPVLIRSYLYLCENEPVHTFGCCDLSIKCSDAKKCVHSDKKYAKGCYYKKNLEAGKIFYGKNRNID
jgi:hypothetical protein